MPTFPQDSPFSSGEPTPELQPKGTPAEEKLPRTKPLPRRDQNWGEEVEPADLAGRPLSERGARAEELAPRRKASTSMDSGDPQQEAAPASLEGNSLVPRGEAAAELSPRLKGVDPWNPEGQAVEDAAPVELSGRALTQRGEASAELVERGTAGEIKDPRTKPLPRKMTKVDAASIGVSAASLGTVNIEVRPQRLEDDPAVLLEAMNPNATQMAAEPTEDQAKSDSEMKGMAKDLGKSAGEVAIHAAKRAKDLLR